MKGFANSSRSRIAHRTLLLLLLVCCASIKKTSASFRGLNDEIENDYDYDYDPDSDDRDTFGCSSDQRESNLERVVKSGINRIYNGREAERGEFPFQARIHARENEDSFTCSAVIIGRSYVLTAAHCVNKRHSIKVTVGDFDTNDSNDGGQEIQVEKVMIHPKYNGTYGDICVLRLAEPIQLSNSKYGLRSVGKACLPSKSETFRIGDMFVAIGWGKTEEETDLPNRLWAVDLPFVTPEQCLDLWEKRWYPGLVCVGGYEGEGAVCPGDAGGPLIKRERDGCAVVIGVLSSGFCRPSIYPIMYTSAFYFKDWIEQMMTQ